MSNVTRIPLSSSRSASRSQIIPHQFVQSRRNVLGVGSIVGTENGLVRVEYFHAVGRTEEHLVPASDLVAVTVSPQTRCYVRRPQDERWRVGRIGQRSDNDYEVNFPNRESFYVPQQHIRVRCATSEIDPVETLIIGGQESPYLHACRLPFRKTIVRQRALSRGMAGILSSSVDLIDYQMRTVRRVLEDRRQRYLLADEVGMGKTIEAGMVLRQYLLDEPDGEALILVPTMLVAQWKGELAEKFAFDESDGRVTVISVDDFQDFDRPENLDLGMLIVDEAHHVASWAYSPEATIRRQYQDLATLAHNTDRFLLLSATPILNHEPDFLAMLHLLEPEIYRLNDVEAFRDRVRRREELATSLLNFKEDGAVFPLRSATESLRRILPEDSIVTAGLSELQPLLSPDSDIEERRRVIRRLRNHIGDTYRLHRRLIRNRRTLELDRIPIFRRSPRTEFDLDSSSDRAHDLLEQWRDAAVGVALEEGMHRETELIAVFLILFRACGTWLPLVGDVAEARIGANLSTRLLRAFSSAELSSLTTIPMFDGEQDLLQALVSIARSEAEDGDRVDLVVESLRGALRRGVKKSVVFSEYTPVCHEIYRRARAVFGQNAVACHSREIPGASAEDDVIRFRDDDSCSVLVCDLSGQEGRNFQYADLLFHADLPFSPNSLEQRIGRLDRIGRDVPFSSVVVTGPSETDDSLHEAWFRVLAEAFQVFSESVASLQYYLELKMPQLAALLFQQGSQGLLDAIPAIREEISRERQAVQHQDLLDQIDVIQHDANDFVGPMKAFDDAAAAIQCDTESWICRGLNFRTQWQHESDGVLKYRPTHNTLLPHEFMVARFTGDEFDWSSYSRRKVLKCPGTRILRIGSPLIDLLARDLDWDDRGRVFAMWRTELEWSSEEGQELVAFRFDYIVEADLTPVVQLLGGDKTTTTLRAFRRRADGYLPPEVSTIFVNLDGHEIDDERQLAILSRPYTKPGDRNLGGERAELVEKLVPSGTWPTKCERVRDVSADLLRSRSDVLLRCESAALRAERDLEALRSRLELRASFESADCSTSEDAMELELDAALVLGIRSPRVILDAVGCFVVSGRRAGAHGDTNQ